MPKYREYKPPARLATGVDCFWMWRQDLGAEGLVRVVPDACADIIYTRTGSSARLYFVGVMTHFEDFRQAAGMCSVGVRLRPGMWRAVAGAETDTLVDQIVPLEAVWGKRARDLLAALEGAKEPAEYIELLGQTLPVPSSRCPVQRAIESIEQSQGQLAMDEAALAAGLSTRQFRRRCCQMTGLGPKTLARILRFQAAVRLAPKMKRRQAELAAQCGYADESHLIAEHREFSGRTPRESASLLEA